VVSEEVPLQLTGLYILNNLEDCRQEHFFRHDCNKTDESLAEFSLNNVFVVIYLIVEQLMSVRLVKQHAMNTYGGVEE